MPAFPPFEVEIYMDEHETSAKYNLAETCCESISVHELLDMAGTTPEDFARSSAFVDKLTYGHIKGKFLGQVFGSPELLQAIANTYDQSAEVKTQDVLITQGAIGANFLALLSVCNPGDHVIAVDPTYSQLMDSPVAFGASVSRWMLKATNQWKLDLDELEALLKKETKLVILNNPNNPTGQLIPTETLKSIVELVKVHAAPNCIILCDEVYRPLFHADSPKPASILELGYPHAVATGSLSKAYSLAGLRVGWMATKDKHVLDAAALRRDYTTISVGSIDDRLASIALSEPTRQKILKRNIELTTGNRGLVQKWIDEQGGKVSWTVPNAGTTAMLDFGRGFDDYSFCVRLPEKIGVMLVPGGKCFQRPGTVRIGYACDTETLRTGLKIAAEYLDTVIA